MAYQLRCREAGRDCGWQGTADTRDELLALFADHVREAHRVPTLTESMGRFLQRVMRNV